MGRPKIAAYRDSPYSLLSGRMCSGYKQYIRRPPLPKTHDNFRFPHQIGNYFCRSASFQIPAFFDDPEIGYTLCCPNRIRLRQVYMIFDMLRYYWYKYVVAAC